jgi:hypothetical protein
VHGSNALYRDDPHWRDLVLFYEYFHGDNGRGAGASHQTGWTALAVRCVEDAVKRRHSEVPVRFDPTMTSPDLRRPPPARPA